VVVRRRETGALVSGFVLPATVADVTLKDRSGGALVATARRRLESGPESTQGEINRE